MFSSWSNMFGSGDSEKKKSHDGLEEIDSREGIMQGGMDGFKKGAMTGNPYTAAALTLGGALKGGYDSVVAEQDRVRDLPMYAINQMVKNNVPREGSISQGLVAGAGAGNKFYTDNQDWINALLAKNQGPDTATINNTGNLRMQDEVVAKALGPQLEQAGLAPQLQPQIRREQPATWNKMSKPKAPMAAQPSRVPVQKSGGRNVYMTDGGGF